MKIQKKKLGGGGPGVVLGGQGGCNEELKFFVKIQKTQKWWSGGRGRVGGGGVFKKMKFLEKFTKKSRGGVGSGGGGRLGGSGWM